MSRHVRRLVLDALTPQEPDIVEFATSVADLSGVDSVNVVLVETDREVQNLKFTVEGSAVDADAVEAAIEGLGGTIHSIDQVVCGDSLVEERDTPQDR